MSQEKVPILTAEEKAIQERTRAIINGKAKFSELNFAEKIDRAVALNCIHAKTSWALTLDVTVPEQLTVLKNWIKEDCRNLFLLDASQLCAPLIDIYLHTKFTKAPAYKDNKEVTIIRSYDNYMVFNYVYATKEGEVVSYFDEKLKLPIKLKTKAEVKLKMLDSFAFVKKMDVNLQLIDISIANERMESVINDCLREAILEVIESKNVSFFELPKYYAAIRSECVTRLQEKMTAYGMNVEEVKICAIDIPNNTAQLLESQYFALAEERRVKEYENEMEERALKFYEYKASIHNKYPEFPITLTEAEKDFALGRYMKRIGKADEYYTEIVNENLAEREQAGSGTLTSKGKENTVEAPVAKKKSGMKLISTIVFAVVMLVGIIVAIAASTVAGLVLLGIAILAYGMFVIVNYDKFKKDKNLSVKKTKQRTTK